MEGGTGPAENASADVSSSTLLRGVAALPSPVFAAVDGGLFDDLPALLKAAGLSFRSLFLDHADAEIERAGPWLVALPEDGDAARLPEAGERGQAVVFWAGAPDELALHRHLRTLNLARIPDWAAEGRERPSPEGDTTYVTVLFRHWDASVLADFLPVLTEAQLARVLGPAEALAFPGEDGRMKLLVRDPAWPPAAPGMLTITADQIAALNERRVEASRKRIARLLRSSSPNPFKKMTDDELADVVIHYERTGRRHGLSTERGLLQWTYLMKVSDNQFLTQPEIRSYLARGPGTADQRLDNLMGAMVLSATRQGRLL